MNPYPSSQCFRVALGFIASAVLAVHAFAESDFEKGNSLYESGHYADAAKAYEIALQKGNEGANVYFNLANANLRDGAEGRAVLNYERALALQPGHPEAAANLAYVRRLLNVPAPPSGALGDALDWIGIDALAVVVASGAWLLVAGLLALFGPWRRVSAGWFLVVAGVTFSTAGLTGMFALHGGPRDPARAIVISKSGATAHYAPADNSRDVQKLPVGSEIRVLQDRGNWVYAELAGGVRGWIAAENVETIVPRAGVADS
jgi:hypothetical protein